MKKSFIILLLFTSTAVGLLSGCICKGSLSDKTTVSSGKKIKTGFYVDNGSRGSGAFLWAQLLFSLCSRYGEMMRKKREYDKK